MSSPPCPDPRSAGDVARRGARAPLAAEALAEEPRRAQLQVAASHARRPTHPAGRAAAPPGPGAEPDHPAGDANPAAQQGGEEERQEEEERQKVQAGGGHPQPVLPPYRSQAPAPSSRHASAASTGRRRGIRGAASSSD